MSECPYLERSNAARRYPIVGFCHGYQDGRLRVASIAEFVHYCTTDQHVECNVYRVRLAWNAEEPGKPRLPPDRPRSDQGPGVGGRGPGDGGRGSGNGMRTPPARDPRPLRFEFQSGLPGQFVPWWGTPRPAGLLRHFAPLSTRPD